MDQPVGTLSDCQFTLAALAATDRFLPSEHSPRNTAADRVTSPFETFLQSAPQQAHRLHSVSGQAAARRVAGSRRPRRFRRELRIRRDQEMKTPVGVWLLLKQPDYSRSGPPESTAAAAHCAQPLIFRQVPSQEHQPLAVVFHPRDDGLPAWTVPRNGKTAERSGVRNGGRLHSHVARPARQDGRALLFAGLLPWDRPSSLL